jgi:CheY-like chemotaxis protein
MGSKKILVVDDERDMRIFVSTVVETLDYGRKWRRSFRKGRHESSGAGHS